MNTLSFLAVLPAVLAITGFVIYRFLGSQKESSRITTQIVEKLRADLPERSSQLSNLPPRELSLELKRDNSLRRTVGDKNFELLELVLRQEHKRSLLVYGICAALFVIGVVAFLYAQTRPKPLIINSWHLESDNPQAGGWAVDLDNVRLRWKAVGPAEDVTVALENVQSGRRTEAIKVGSGTGAVLFQREALVPLLAERQFKRQNRVRAVMKTSKGDLLSEEFLLHVGMKILALPDPGERSLTMAALIDNRLVQNYQFEAKALAWRRKPPVEPKTWGGAITGKAKVSIPDYPDYDWTGLKTVYFGFDDLKLIRCEPEG